MAKRSKKKLKRKSPQEKKAAVKPVRISLWEKHPDWMAMSILVILLFIFFAPVMLSNKTLLPPDSIASKGFSNFIKDALARGIYPLWNPYIFCGMPSFASLSSAPYVDIFEDVILGVIWLIKRIIPLPDFTRIFIYYFLFGGAVYLLLRSKKLVPGAALFSATAMVFMTQVVAYAAFGHITKLGTALFIPVIFLILERLLEKRNLLFFCLMGLAVGLQLLRKHVQICFYTQLIIGIYFIYWAVITLKEKRKIGSVIHGAGLLIGAVALGVLLSSVLNLSVREYAEYSIRGGGATGGLDYGYATNWSFPPSEILTFFIPSFMGFGGGTYWGPMPFTDFPLYFGIVVFLLAGFALLLNRNRTTWFFAILACIVLVISFGRHLPLLYGPMFKYLPFFSKFRAPKMIHIVFEFSAVVLAGFGLHGILDLNWPKDDVVKKIRRYLLGFGGVVVLLLLILLVGKGAYLGWASGARAGAEAAHNRAVVDGFKSLILYGIAAGTIYLTLRKKRQSKFLPFLLAGLVFIDFWVVNKNFIDPKPKAEENVYFSETEAVEYLKARAEKDHFRILPVQDSRSPNWYMYHFIQCAWGYQGAKLKIFQDLADAFGIPNPPNNFFTKYLKVEGGRYVLKQSEEISPREAQLHQTFLKLTNVRYILCPYNLPDPTLRNVVAPENRGQPGLFEFTDFTPRVFFPREVRAVQGKEAILGFMTSGRFDPLNTAIIEERLPSGIIPSDSNRAEIVAYDLHRIEIEANVHTPSLMVLSEMYYPAGWKVFVDGQEDKIYKTDYALRSVLLQPGSHRVEFVFKPRMFTTGLYITIGTFVLLVAGVIVGLGIERKKQKPQSRDDENQSA